MEIVIGITKILEAGVNKFLEIIESVPSGDLIAFTTILLSFLIPLFIAQLNSDSEFKDFDIRVILDYVLNFRKLLAFTLVSLIAVIAIGTLPSNKFNIIKIICFVLWFVCILFITKKVLVFFTWTKGSISVKDTKWSKNSKNWMRLDYLKKITKKDDLELSFNSIWKVETKTTGLEKEIINIFIEKVNYLIDKKDFEAATNLLLDFHSNLPNRNEYGLILNYMPKTLDILLNLSELSAPQQNNKNVDLLYKDQAYEVIFETVIDIEKLSIENNLTSFFYHSLKEFIDHLEKEEVGIIEDFYDQICKTLFEEITTKELTDEKVFDGFPNEWKITIDTVKPPIPFESLNVFPFIWFQNFFELTFSRIHEKNQIFPDRQVETISKNLFPDIQRKIISSFFTALFSDGEEKPAEWIINTKWRFGKFQTIGAFGVINSDMESVGQNIMQKLENLKQETYSLIIFLIENGWFRFDKESIIELLEKLKADFENLKFEEKTAEEAKRLEYLEMINELLKRLKGEN